MQRFIKRGYLHGPDMDEFNKIESARDNHIRNEIEDHAMLLSNPVCRALPVIVFKDVTLLMIAYKDHIKDIDHFKVHCCRCNTNVLSPISDQLFYDVVKPRTLKSTKVGFKSTRCQIVGQLISLKVPDSTNVTSVGRTDHDSV